MNITKVSTKPPFPELRGCIANVRYPAIAEIKYDGELNLIFYSKNRIYSINKYGNCRTGFKALDDLNTTLKTNGIEECALLTEMYVNGGKLGALYDMLEMKGVANESKLGDNLTIFPFDLISLNNKNYQQSPLIDRKETLFELLQRSPSFDIVENHQDVEDCFFTVTSAGFEGIVVKPLDSRLVMGPCTWVKMKKKDQTDYQVTLIDPTLERIEITTPVVTGSQSIVKIGGISVGVKAPNRYKKHIKLGDLVTIEHQGVLKSGSLRHPVLIPKKGW